MKRWKRDLGIVREQGPDTPAFRAAVQRAWDELEELEDEVKRLRDLLEDNRRLALGAALDDAERRIAELEEALRKFVDSYEELSGRYGRVVDRLERLEVERL